MRASAEFCRAQAAIQRAKALAEPLENRRTIAAHAVKAWEAEAIAADKRDSVNGSPLDKLDTAISLEFARETDQDATASPVSRE